MGTLHVAAMPFPSVQGTQAAVRAMVDAEHADGREPALLTYAHGGFELTTPWPHHRITDVTRDRSLRSGPSLRKVVEDAQLGVAARRLAARLRPHRVIAHHVEASAACLGARVGPLLYLAHTALEPELPSYVPASWSRRGAGALAARAGAAIEVTLARRASAVAAVSPWLRDHLADKAGRAVQYVPVPWTAPAPITADERKKARARFGFDDVSPVVVYAGNLDAYQGLDVLVRAFAILHARRPNARLLVATDSVAAPLEKALWSAGCAAAGRFAPLADEPDRRVAHAAADLACVPRSSPGGLPIKLLDALARGVPVVASRSATAGLDLTGRVMLVADDDAEAIAAAWLLALEGRDAAREMAARGHAFVRDEHAPARYLEAIDAAWRARG